MDPARPQFGGLSLRHLSGSTLLQVNMGVLKLCSNVVTRINVGESQGCVGVNITLQYLDLSVTIWIN